MLFRFSKKIKPFVEGELMLALQARRKGDVHQEFRHLENAHVLGQESTYHHTRVHFLMLLWGIRQRSAGEAFGQLYRMVGAFTKTAIGLVPEGNTGGTNVSPFKKMPIKAEYKAIIFKAKSNA